MPFLGCDEDTLGTFLTFTSRHWMEHISRGMNERNIYTRYFSRVFDWIGRLFFVGSQPSNCKCPFLCCLFAYHRSITVEVIHWSDWFYLDDGSDWKSLITMYCGNIVGVWGLANIVQSSYLSLSERANDLILNKAYLLTELPLIDILIVSIMCGVFVHIAVSVWKNERVKSEVAKVVITLWAISSFILCGFEHCIADMFYLFVASENVFPLLNQIVFIGLITIGNSLGGLLSHNFYKISIDRNK